jgi:hypothetical protein
MEGSPAGTIGGNGNCLFQRLHTFVAFEIIQNIVQLHINTSEGYKMNTERKQGAWFNNVE